MILFKKIKIIGWNHWSIWALIGIYTFTRIYYLEADLPPWDRMAYQTIDEAYYAIAAYDWSFSDFGKYENLPFNFLQNCIVYISSLLFGWSYFSLRMGSFVLGAMGLLLIYSAYLSISAQAFAHSLLARNLIFLLSGLLIVLNIGFYYSSVVLEPSISVAFFGAALILVFTKPVPNPYIVGALLVFGPLYVYPYAAVFSFSAFLVFICLSFKNGWKYLYQGSMGALAVFASFVLLMAMAYNDTIMEFFNTTSTHAESRLIDITNYPLGYLVSQFLQEDIPAINLFAYSPNFLEIFFFVFAAVLIFSIFNSKNVSASVYLVLAMVVMRFAVLFFEKTHFQRKTIDISFLALFGLVSFWVLTCQFVLPHAEKHLKKKIAHGIMLTVSAFFLLAANYTNASAFYREFTAPKNYHNKTTMLDLGKKFSNCIAVGEWGYGLNIYGLYHAKLNSYRFGSPNSFNLYSKLMDAEIKKENVIVISTNPIGPKLSEKVKKQLIPVYFFEVNDGGTVPSPYAVFVHESQQSIMNSGKCRFQNE